MNAKQFQLFIRDGKWEVEMPIKNTSVNIKLGTWYDKDPQYNRLSSSNTYCSAGAVGD